jgi:prepilin-type N-terminal cleavage/methylation domain-containing protein
MESTAIRGPIAEHPGNKFCGGRRTLGFSMLEVLISTAILAILVVILSQMLQQVGGAWTLGNAQMERSERGRAILEYISRELQAAQLPVNRTSQNSLELMVNLPTTINSKYRNRDSIFWQAPLATDQTLGDIAEIGYFVQWDETTTPANPHANLCRLFINPTDTVNFKIYPTSGDPTTPTVWLDDDVIKNVAPGDKSDTTKPYQGLFAEDVIALWVTCLDPTGVAIVQSGAGNTFDSRSGYTYTATTGTSVSLTGCVLPAAIDLSFVLLDSHSAKLVTSDLESAIKELAANSSITNANDFVTAARKDSRFKTIQSGLQPCMTRVYLSNSK